MPETFGTPTGSLVTKTKEVLQKQKKFYRSF
jgi:hypothetical protein